MRRGMTVLEVLITLAVIGVLVALLVPAVQAARSTALRMACSSHLRQIGLAVYGYESTWGCYPSGALHKYQLLPYLGQDALYQARPDGFSRDPDEMWEPISGLAPAIYRCPADGSGWEFETQGKRDSAASYLACKGSHYGSEPLNNGAFPFVIGASMSSIRTRDVTRGISNTAFFSEILHLAPGDSQSRLRNIWFLPGRFQMSREADLERFISECESLPRAPRDYGWIGGGFFGIPWYNGWVGSGTYYHSLPPNRPSCSGRFEYEASVISAASLHSGGVNLLAGDAHVQFVSDSIDRTVWRDMASRHATSP